MAQGRGSASGIGVIVGITLLALLLHFEIVHAATYTVGDSGGWAFNVVNWPNGKQFRAGDTLIFKYNPSAHNVVVVDENGYSNCKTPDGAQVHKSGNDQIKLSKGQNYFICNFPGHCESAMKIAVNAV
ncbi:basic blue protein-like [Telopea speciosissima]|uniref:basic blue protein-like n=1 Tax=Telopea speciosissima TaxID=54955 RepID=UPI001CC54A37|nr:basic blue protein-like [Telopea speciosissima]XP_043710153.1 basic blue protein-like [Telopea speciosissima]